MGKDTDQAMQFTLANILNNRDILLPLAVVGILMIMILPLPPMVLDITLSIGITLSVLIILVAMYIQYPLEFSVFPSLLLIVTLYRLSLNVASTRLILLNGHEGTDAAGTVIRSFGQFVVGGNPVVGLIVFIILVTINFVVITKGSGRIAEVAARFTLDAMPGKQMSIDADLNAGLIDEQTARERRSQIEQQADFYGAMDGASKFVRGDAIAGIIITLVNIIGGLIIGVVQHSMNLANAANNYTILTIGDGLVTQIPALIVSTAAGIVVSRASSKQELGESLTMQVFMQPKALRAASVTLLAFGLIPGLPNMAFLTLAVVTGAGSYFAERFHTKLLDKAAAEELKAPVEEPEQIERLLLPDMMALEVGYGLIPLIDSEQNGDLLERVKAIRRQLAMEMGFVVPPLHIRDNLELKPGAYRILVRGTEVTRGELMTGHYLAMSTGDDTVKLPGIPTTEPAFGLPATWISERDREAAQLEGFTVVDLSTVMATHITEIIRSHAHELLGRQEVQELLENLRQTYSKAIEGVVPELISIGTLQKILQNLLKERIPIRDLRTIIEVAAEYAPQIKNPDTLTEYVRQAMNRTITHQYKGDDGKLYIMMLDQDIEETLLKSIKQSESESYLAVEPTYAQRILTAINNSSSKFSVSGTQPILVTLPAIRPHLRSLLEKFVPGMIVLSNNEISPGIQIESLGTVRLSDAY